MKYILLIGFCISGLGCEQNPIGDNKIDTPNRSINGTVGFVRSGINPEGIFVWLDGFDIFTYTDSQGKFEFLLPPPTAQANSKGVSGAFHVFYYVANFHLGSTRVFTQNGNFLYSIGEISSEGELTPKKTLLQKLDTHIEVQPSSANSESIKIVAGKTDFILRVDVTLRAFTDSVVVFYPGLFEGIFGPLMFRNVETNEVKVISSTVAGFVNNPYDTVNTTPLLRTMVVPIFPDELGKGTFEVIPFIRVESSDTPEGIKRELALDFLRLGEEYLRVPHLRSGNNRYFTLQ